MKSNYKQIKKALELYTQRQAEKIPSDDNINFELSEDLDARIKTQVVFEKRTPSLKRMCLVAACLVVTGCLIFSVFTLLGKQETPPALTESSNTEYSENSKAPTVELKTYSPVKDNTNAKELTPYKSLDELLENLRVDDNHEQNNGFFSVESTATSSDILKLSQKVLFGDYYYVIDENRDNSRVTTTVNLFKIVENKVTLIKSIYKVFTDFSANEGINSNDKIYGILRYSDRLVIVNGRGDDSLRYVEFLMYDTSDILNPKLIKTITQSGSFSTCFLTGNRIFLIGGDGVCARGFSRPEDTSSYVPSISQDGRNVGITDDNNFILGTPTQVKYTSISVIDSSTGSIQDIKAFYGDIVKCYYGADYFTFLTKTYKYSLTTMQLEWKSSETLYFFKNDNQKIEFQGKLTLNELFGFPVKYYPDNDNIDENNYYEGIGINSVYRSGNNYRITGVYSIGYPGNYESGYVVGLFDENLEAKFLIAKEVKDLLDLEQTFNYEKCQILYISILKIKSFDFVKETLYVSVDYSHEVPVIIENEKHIEGYEDNIFDNSYMLKIKDNIYLSRNYDDTGLDLLDFSDPSYVNITSLMLPENYNICSEIYDFGGVYGVYYMTSSIDSTGSKIWEYKVMLFKINTEEFTLENLYDADVPNTLFNIIEYEGSYYPLIG